MKNIIEKALANSYTFAAYKNLFAKLVASGKTTGHNQTEGYVSFTKLNWSRYNRTLKNAALTEDTLSFVNQLDEPIKLLIITEAWCGDATQILPYIETIEANAPLISAHLVLRDEHPDLMNEFLTNGGKAIPKVIVLDQKNEVLGSWGPRPSELQTLVKEFKQEFPESTSTEVTAMTQKWYAANKGLAIQNELVSLVEDAVCVEC